MSEYEKHFRDVGLAMRSFERSIDSAVIDGCDLLKAATVKSMAIGVAGPVSQPILAQLFESLQLAIQARGQACDAHLQLKDFRSVIRKGPAAFGDCCGTPSSGASDLRVVAQSA